MDIRLCLVAQAQVEREVRPHAPLVAREDAHIHLVYRQFRRAGIDGELRGAAAERADHRRRIAELLEEQRPPVAFDRRDGGQLRLAVRARHGRFCASRTGASAPPPNVNVPLKFCGETLSSVCARSRTPNRHECRPFSIEL